MHADEVDQAILDQRHPLVRAVEQLAHGDRHDRGRAHLAKVIVGFGGQGIFDEEWTVVLEFFEQPNRITRLDAFMHIVQQFDVVAAGVANVLEHFGCGFQVRLRVHERVLRQAEVGVFKVGVPGELGRAIAAELNANVAKALFDVFSNAVLQLLVVAAARVRVAIHGEAAFPADELIHRHVRALAFDVPKRHVEAAERVVQYRTIAPVGTRVGILPEVLDVIYVPAARERVEIFLDRGHHCQRALIEGGATESVQTGLARLDLRDHEARPLRRGFDRAHPGDFQPRQTSR